MSRRIRSLTVAGLRAAVGIALATWVLVQADPSRIDLGRAGAFIAAFAAAAVGGAVVEGLQLRILLRESGASISMGRAVRLVSLGHFFNLVTPGGTGGDFAKAWFLMRHAVGRRVELGTIVAVDRGLAGTALLALAALLSLAAYPQMVGHPLLRGLALAALCVVVCIGGLIVLVIALPELGPGRRDGFLTRAWSTVDRVTRRPRVPMIVLLLATLRIGLQLGIFAAAARSLIAFDDGLCAAAIAGLALIGNALPLTPGGLGVGEAAFERLYGVFGVSGGAVLVLLWRAGSLPVAALGLWVFASGAGMEWAAASAPCEPSAPGSVGWGRGVDPVLSRERSLSA